jgi:Ca2+-binding EF-hand superfamily protein
MVKIRDARKAFRRRYASRTNLDTIFSQYDNDKKGYITAQNLFDQG